MFEPLFKVHTTVGMILNGFLKTTATVCVLFAAISTAPVVPDCVLLFYNIFIVNRNHAVVFTFKIFPSKDISTPFTEDMESTLPFTLL